MAASIFSAELSMENMLSAHQKLVAEFTKIIDRIEAIEARKGGN